MSANLEFREIEWGRADGTRVKIKDMDLGHLVNVLNWVHDHDRSYSDRTRQNFIAEAEYRKVFLFAESKPYPGLVDGRWKVIDPATGEGSIIRPPDEYLDAVKDNPVYKEMSEWVQAKRQSKSRVNRSVDK